MRNLVSVKWLDENIDNENVVVFDCRYDLTNKNYGIDSYKEGHIKNAFYMDLEKDLADEVSEHGGRHPLPDMKRFKRVLESFGVSNDSVVVAYDDGEIAMAGRLWWLMKYVGHEKVYVLNGGIAKWKEAELQIDSGVQASGSKSEYEFKINEEIVADMEMVKKNMDNKSCVIVDSRSRERYLGLEEPIDPVAGHIPNAKNYFWQDAILDGYMKDEKMLEQRFEDLKKYDEIIVHCGSGITGCVNYIALDEIGIKSKLYAGSWSDWISYKENPVASSK